MPRRFVSTCAGLLVLVLARAGHPAAQSTNPDRGGSRGASAVPSLVVLLVSDQFRADYVSLYSDAWTGGLKEIVTQGAVFTEAAYPYGVTKTCAGHGTIGTGMLPSTHGLIDNQWYERSTHSFVSCTDDGTAHDLLFGGGRGDEQHSAKRYLVRNFADELKQQAKGRPRVVSLSLKARAAIGLGGHGGPDSTIVWKEDGGVRFVTSDALTTKASSAVEAFLKAHPVNPQQFETWERLKPLSAYKFFDEAPGEPANRQTFPHVFEEAIRTSNTTPSVFDSWDDTPFTDDYLGAMAEHLIVAEQLGQRQTTDLLAVSFSSLDLIGHDYGPRSHEVQDALLRLDATIGRLLATLDARVGRNRYVLAFSSDHGVAMLPEQSFPRTTVGRLTGGLGQPGRLANISVANAVEAALDRTLGRSSYVEAISVPSIYFKPGVLARVRANPTAQQAVEKAATGVRGVTKVYWSADLAATTPTNDPILAAHRKSYIADRSGDLVYVLERDWVTSAGTNHGSPQDYDQRVPLAFLGAGITKGQFAVPAAPVDIVPTISEIVGIHMPRTDGHPLREALERGTQSSR
jgi:predicted AlkP superfamily pyrophosphatase or phosphodiesterase